jgi:hypothetical protein
VGPSGPAKLTRFRERPTASWILRNQKAIVANQGKLDRILANQKRIEANQKRIRSNQAKILANQKKILSR